MQRFDDRVLKALSFQNAANSRIPQKIGDSLFIFIVARQNAALIFERVSERKISNVMQQGSNADKPLLIGRNAGAAPDRRKDAVCHPGGPERMLKSRMDRRRKDQIRRSELFDSPQALELRRIHQLDFERIHLDVAVNGVANEFRLAHTRTVIPSKGLASPTKGELV